MVRAPEDVCDITPEPPAAAGSATGDRLMVITLSSFTFRLLTIFQVHDNEANRAYFLQAAVGRTLEEEFAEVANLCCGALNRQMAAFFPHLAMSIPYMLNEACLDHLPHLKPAYTRRFTISINDSVKVSVTLCMCCSAPVAIPVSAPVVEQTTGELELF